MTENELKEHYAAYTDCWKLLRKYSDPVEDELFWTSLMDEANQIYEKYGDSKFVKDLVVATVLEIERVFGNGKSE